MAIFIPEPFEFCTNVVKGERSGKGENAVFAPQPMPSHILHYQNVAKGERSARGGKRSFHPAADAEGVSYMRVYFRQRKIPAADVPIKKRLQNISYFWHKTQGKNRRCRRISQK